MKSKAPRLVSVTPAHGAQGQMCWAVSQLLQVASQGRSHRPSFVPGVTQLSSWFSVVFFFLLAGFPSLETKQEMVPHPRIAAGKS